MEERKPQPWRKYVWSLILYLMAGAVILPLFINVRSSQITPAPITLNPEPAEEETDTGEPSLTITCDGDKLTAYDGGVMTCEVGVLKNKPVVGATTGEVEVTIGKLPQSERLPYINAGTGTLGGNNTKVEDGNLQLKMQLRSLPASFLLGYPAEKISDELNVSVDLKTDEYDLNKEIFLPYPDKIPTMESDYEQTKGDFYYDVKVSRDSLAKTKVFDYEITVESRNTSDGSLNDDPFQTVLVTLYPTDVRQFEDKYSRPNPPMNHTIVMVDGQYRSISTDGKELVPQTPFTRYLFQYASRFKDYGRFDRSDESIGRYLDYLVSEGVVGTRPYTNGDDPDRSNGLKDGKLYWPSHEPIQRIRLVLEKGVGKITVEYDGTKSFSAKSQVVSVVPVSYCQTYGNRMCEHSETPAPRRPEGYLFLYERWHRDAFEMPSIRTNLAIPIK